MTLKVVSESRVTWATSAPTSLPRPLCAGVRPDVRDSPIEVWGWRHNNSLQICNNIKFYIVSCVD